MVAVQNLDTWAWHPDFCCDYQCKQYWVCHALSFQDTELCPLLPIQDLELLLRWPGCDQSSETSRRAAIFRPGLHWGQILIQKARRDSVTVDKTLALLPSMYLLACIHHCPWMELSSVKTQIRSDSKFKQNWFPSNQSQKYTDFLTLYKTFKYTRRSKILMSMSGFVWGAFLGCCLKQGFPTSGI